MYVCIRLREKERLRSIHIFNRIKCVKKYACIFLQSHQLPRSREIVISHSWLFYNRGRGGGIYVIVIRNVTGACAHVCICIRMKLMYYLYAVSRAHCDFCATSWLFWHLEPYNTRLRNADRTFPYSTGEGFVIARYVTRTCRIESYRKRGFTFRERANFSSQQLRYPRNIEIGRQFTKLDRNKVKVESHCARCRYNVWITIIYYWISTYIFFRKILINLFMQRNDWLKRILKVT